MKLYVQKENMMQQENANNHKSCDMYQCQKQHFTVKETKTR